MTPRIINLLLILSISQFGFSQTENILIDKGSTWRYLDNGSDQGVLWQLPGFDDSAWAIGNGQLGYGDGDEMTTLSYGADANNKYPTTYFRATFDATDVSQYIALSFNLLKDDGAVIYLNGLEVVRSNMPEGSIGYQTYAASTISGSEEDVYSKNTSDVLALVTGTNTIAIEIHQRSATSSDISFDLELIGDTIASITRGPYLQMGTTNSVIIRWRTNAPTDSRVLFGSDYNNLDREIVDETEVTEHIMELSNLSPDNKYYYAIGNSGNVMAGSDLDHFFRTAPEVGSKKPVRIWVIGDSGTKNDNARAVRDAFLDYTRDTYSDVWLMLGDNAYSDGKDSEYQEAVFENMYEDILINTILWSTPGNHDYRSANLSDESGPYFDIFSFPKNGEAGGLSSGTEAYYSFDFANIHFVSLDSHDSDRDLGSPMLTWLENDLASTTQDWIIAFWHHPPYSKGSHDSDASGHLTEVRENFLPILESYGVDLVLNGHSHAYERSYLLNEHYGYSNTLNNSMIVDNGDGKSDGDGAYVKTITGSEAGNGAVYCVAGSSGKTSGGSLDHPAMYSSLNELGSVLIDVNDNQFDFKFITDQGTIMDYFSIEKEDTSSSDTTITSILNSYSQPVSIYPNIIGSQNQQIAIRGIDENEQLIHLAIYDAIGSLVYQQSINLHTSRKETLIKIPSHLGLGLHYINIIGSENMYGSRFIKQ